MKPVYIAIGLGIAVVALAYWCFKSGPCAPDAPSAPDGSTNPIVSAVQSVAATIGGLVTGGTDLQNEDNGLIFGGGA
jgi:hypothetical protein